KNPSMQSTRSLSVAVQVAPEAERILEAELGEAALATLERALQEAVDALASAETEAQSGEICFYVTTDAEIRALNRAYRGVDRATDVLSFGYEPLPSVPTPLGDIIISVETALRQATPNRHDLLTELLMLALHGTLHLMGYDDATETERAAMNTRAASTLRTLGYAACEEWYSRYEETGR
ncbi:MAG: rRNA maturation RNase YbeY, partial [Fimbriimonadales bacterium]|nr:rRNA maturation RNase YbeY [Fimbriimonadales bacterium]